MFVCSWEFDQVSAYERCLPMRGVLSGGLTVQNFQSAGGGGGSVWFTYPWLLPLLCNFSVATFMIPPTSRPSQNAILSGSNPLCPTLLFNLTNPICPVSSLLISKYHPRSSSRVLCSCPLPPFKSINTKENKANCSSNVQELMLSSDSEVSVALNYCIFILICTISPSFIWWKS